MMFFMDYTYTQDMFTPTETIVMMVMVALILWLLLSHMATMVRGLKDNTFPVDTEKKKTSAASILVILAGALLTGLFMGDAQTQPVHETAHIEFQQGEMNVASVDNSGQYSVLTTGTGEKYIHMGPQVDPSTKKLDVFVTRVGAVEKAGENIYVTLPASLDSTEASKKLLESVGEDWFAKVTEHVSKDKNNFSVEAR